MGGGGWARGRGEARNVKSHTWPASAFLLLGPRTRVVPSYDRLVKRASRVPSLSPSQRKVRAKLLHCPETVLYVLSQAMLLLTVRRHSSQYA